MVFLKDFFEKKKIIKKKKFPQTKKHAKLPTTLKVDQSILTGKWTFASYSAFSWFQIIKPVNSFPASGDFCYLLITFANSLDPDQARQNVGPDLDPNCLTLWWYSVKIFLKKDNLKKTQKLLLFADNLCKQFEPRSGPAKLRAWSGSKLFDTDGIPERFFWKKNNLKKRKKSHRQKSMQNYPACKELNK